MYICYASEKLSSFRKYPYPPQGLLEILGGREGFQKPEFLKESMKPIWNCQGCGWEDFTLKKYLGEGMDIFWSGTVTL